MNLEIFVFLILFLVLFLLYFLFLFFIVIIFVCFCFEVFDVVLFFEDGEFECGGVGGDVVLFGLVIFI